jgi:hypothetical protein
MNLHDLDDQIWVVAVGQEAESIPLAPNSVDLDDF